MTTTTIDQQAKHLLQFGMFMREHMLSCFLKAHTLLAKGDLLNDLSPPQIQMLMNINKQGETTVSELARQLAVSPPSASVMVDRLVEKGALVRERSSSDRRVVVIRPSEGARNFIEQVELIMLQELKKLIEILGPQITGEWCDVISSIQRKVQEEK